MFNQFNNVSQTILTIQFQPTILVFSTPKTKILKTAYRRRRGTDAQNERNQSAFRTVCHSRYNDAALHTLHHSQPA